MSIRFVICIDIDENLVSKAYGHLYKAMTKTGLEWESSDEAYDDIGDEISEEDLSAARLKYFEDTISFILNAEDK